MSASRKTSLALACLLLVVSEVGLARSASGSDFTAFAEDEDACRHLGTAAIEGASGPSAAHRYDFTYHRCMVAHGRMRQMGDYAQGGQPAGGPDGNPHSFDYPDAFYSIPYATPGYGYDGFSY